MLNAVVASRVDAMTDMSFFMIEISFTSILNGLSALLGVATFEVLRDNTAWREHWWIVRVDARFASLLFSSFDSIADV